MSIISSKAEHVYKGNTLMQEAYIAGATRPPTDEEIETCARGFFQGTPGPTNWDDCSEVSKQAWLHAAKKALAAVNAMKTKEQQ